MTLALTSGLGSQLGLFTESTYGTEGTVNKFFEYGSETLSLSRAYVLSQQLRAGRLYQSSSRRSATTKNAAGNVMLEVPTVGFGSILNLMHGEAVTPVEIEAGAFKQVHKIGTTDSFKKSVTVQIGRPSDEGVVNAFTLPGSVALNLALAIQTGGFLEATLGLDCKDELTSVGLATASYPAGIESFNFTQCEVKVNSIAQTQVRGATITIETPKDVGRYYLGTTTKAIPLENAYQNSKIELTVDYKDNALYKLFAENTVVPVELNFVGEKIEAKTTKKELKIKCAACGLEGDSPNVTGPPVLQQQIPMVILDNGSNPPVEITYVSVDTGAL